MERVLSRSSLRAERGWYRQWVLSLSGTNMQSIATKLGTSSLTSSLTRSNHYVSWKFQGFGIQSLRSSEAAELMQLAKNLCCRHLYLVGHVTRKETGLRCWNTWSVLTTRGEHHHTFRILEQSKNRWLDNEIGSSRYGQVAWVPIQESGFP